MDLLAWGLIAIGVIVTVFELRRALGRANRRIDCILDNADEIIAADRQAELNPEGSRADGSRPDLPER